MKSTRKRIRFFAEQTTWIRAKEQINEESWKQIYRWTESRVSLSIMEVRNQISDPVHDLLLALEAGNLYANQRFKSIGK